jgi:ADP-ribose pyrophosphatase
MKKVMFACLLLCSTAGQTDELTRQRYLELIAEYPHCVSLKGDATQGEIEIILDEEKMIEIEKKSGRDVGVLKEDRYWIWINDACLFPSGQEGVYGRIFLKRGLTSLAPGVAVVPINSEGKIVLICQFRHATRSWEIELPRGFVDENETLEEAAKRETLEETGGTIEEVRLLGKFPPDSGALSAVVPVYIAYVTEQGARKQEVSEAIIANLELSIEEVEEAFLNGYHLCQIHGEWRQVHFRDPFLAYALLKLKNQ